MMDCEEADLSFLLFLGRLVNLEEGLLAMEAVQLVSQEVGLDFVRWVEDYNKIRGNS